LIQETEEEEKEEREFKQKDKENQIHSVAEALFLFLCDFLHKYDTSSVRVVIEDVFKFGGLKSKEDSDV